MEFNLGPHNTLIEVSRPWVFEEDGDAAQLEADMIDFMERNGGLGLAANQIGLSVRVFVMGSNTVEGFPKPFAVFNPVIKESSTTETLNQEGCLSYPDLYMQIKRPEWIVAEYQDSKGNVNEIRIDGYLAKCFQHELDHLNGICFVDKASPLKLQLAMKKLRKRK